MAEQRPLAVLCKTLSDQPEQQRTMFYYPLTYNLNTRPPHLFIQDHVLRNLKLHHVPPDHLASIFLRPPSSSPCTYQSQPFTPPNRGIQAPPLHMPEPSKSRFSHLVHESHVHLLPNIFIPNLISPNVPLHPSQYPYFNYFHFCI